MKSNRHEALARHRKVVALADALEALTPDADPATLAVAVEAAVASGGELLVRLAATVGVNTPSTTTQQAVVRRMRRRAGMTVAA